MTHVLEFLHYPDDPDSEVAMEMLTEAVMTITSGIEIRKRIVRPGSLCCGHTMEIRINGKRVRDVATGPPVPGNFVNCEVGDLPPCWAVEAAILNAIKPSGILFLCVANSARSQLAEGIARSMAPGDVKVFSAGSAPTVLREEVVRVLAEIGIDASSQYAKPIDAIPTDQVDAVITVCGEEVCPVWLHPAARVHWAMPDPAAVQGPDRIRAFREVRNELLMRIRRVFQDWHA